MRHIEKTEKVSLQNLLSQINKGEFVIPDFQREFEWNPWDVADLLKSIFMDYYIGTLLFWKSTEENIEILNCESIYGFKGDLNPMHIVLDGQQRLSALYYAFYPQSVSFPKRKSICHFFINIDDLLEANFEEAFYYEWDSKRVRKLLEDKEEQYKNNILPISVLTETFEFFNWLKGYEEFLLKDGGDEEFVNEKYESLKKIVEATLTEYSVSYIELDRNMPIEKVCDIFTKINSKGVPLSIFDLLNAILRPHEINLKEDWRTVKDDLVFVDNSRTKVHLLQIMSIKAQDYCSPRYLYYLVPNAKKTVKLEDNTKEEKILISDAATFEEEWEFSVDAYKNAVKTLKNPREYGVIDMRFLPYNGILPIFSALKAYIDNELEENHLSAIKKLRQWYWASVFTQNYSSSVESQSAKDFKLMKKWFEDDSAVPEIVERFKEAYQDLDLLNETKQNSAIYNAIFNLYIVNGARDWKTLDLPDYSQLDDHHIVPRSWGKDIVGEDINSILNRTPLLPATNRHIISDRLPNEYLPKLFESNSDDDIYELFASHQISKKAIEILSRDSFGKEDYYEFLEERKKEILSQIESIFEEPTNDSDPDTIEELIALGENSKLEFKSSYRWDMDMDVQDKKMENIILKTISAFNNAHGGTLIIGVDDNGVALGLERDYATLKNANKDEFEIHLRNQLNKTFGTVFSTTNLKVTFPILDGKEICRIDVDAGTEPVFLEIMDEHGQKSEKFYVRSGNTSQPLEKGSEITEYIRKRF
jgi:hypothetical protein